MLTSSECAFQGGRSQAPQSCLLLCILPSTQGPSTVGPSGSGCQGTGGLCSLECHGPVEETPWETDHNSREAQSPVEAQPRAQEGFLKEVLLAQPERMPRS